MTNPTFIKPIKDPSSPDIAPGELKQPVAAVKQRIDEQVEDYSDKFLKPLFKRLLLEAVEISGLTKSESKVLDIVIKTPGLNRWEKEQKEAPLEFSLYRVVEYSDDCIDALKSKGLLCIVLKQFIQRIPVLDATKNYCLIQEFHIEAIVIDKPEETAGAKFAA